MTRTPAFLAVALLALALAGCSVEKSPFPGDKVDRDPEEVWAALMRLPDSDQARQQYRQLDAELRQALTAAIPKLSPWKLSENNPGSRAACGARFPGVGNDGESESLGDHRVPGNLPDADYEKALTIIGTVAQRYGFDPRPQRLHDAPGSHDAMFHNIADEGEFRSAPRRTPASASTSAVICSPLPRNEARPRAEQQACSRRSDKGGAALTSGRAVPLNYWRAYGSPSRRVRVDATIPGPSEFELPCSNPA
ncbi:LppA family lipoprotein [Amycolatopsis sp. WGS_07]|uniref:LppA family lipoprotein n=1 Tax=Amycolatopsis sp. WGS_07 TaxID=3076764 RepID=UPI0038732D18